MRLISPVFSKVFQTKTPFWGIFSKIFAVSVTLKSAVKPITTGIV